jgi:membrane-bound ClpP family serine protease
MKSEEQTPPKIPIRYIIRRYLLFQIPGVSILILVSLFFLYVVGVPVWTIWLLVGAWILKELVTVPFTWRLYVRPRKSPTELMIDQYGIAAERLDPKGFVRFHSELWEAVSSDPAAVIEKGKTVRILEVRDMKLIVEKVQG